MKPPLARYARSQAGYTLVELMVASAIGVIVMTGLTSVLLTSWRAGTTATSRVVASGQIRNFEFVAYDDFALANVPDPSGCAASAASPCTTQPLVLTGVQASNAANPVSSPHQVIYTWDGADLLERQVGNNPPRETASGVSAFSWYVAGAAPHQTVVVTITVTVLAYSQTQTFLFYPRVNP